MHCIQSFRGHNLIMVWFTFGNVTTVLPDLNFLKHNLFLLKTQKLMYNIFPKFSQGFWSLQKRKKNYYWDSVLFFYSTQVELEHFSKHKSGKNCLWYKKKKKNFINLKSDVSKGQVESLILFFHTFCQHRSRNWIEREAVSFTQTEFLLRWQWLALLPHML